MDAGNTWECTSCGEPSPADFDRCWRCGATADGHVDPEFRAAVAPRLLTHCLACAYPLEGLGATGDCPECGKHFDRAHLDTPSDETPAEEPVDTTPYASLPARLVAFMINLILVFATIGLLVFLAHLLVEAIAGAPMSRINGQRITAWLMLFVPWVYCAIMESSRHRATLGKMFVGIEVVTTEGDRLSLSRASGRFLAKALTYMLFGFGFLLASVTSRRQALHDLLAGTIVVRRERD